MNTSLSETMRTRLTLASIGLVQGLVYYLAYEFWPGGMTSKAMVVAAIFLVSGFGLTAQLSWTGDKIQRLLTIAPAIPFVLALLAFWVWRQVPADTTLYRSDEVRMPTLVFAAAVTLLLMMPSIQQFQCTGLRSSKYGILFRRFWENLYIIALGAGVVGAFWAIILLWTELFKLIDVTIFDDVFTHVSFVCMGLATVFGYAIALGREWEKLTSTLRAALFIVLKALLPLLAVIALLFLVSLPFTGLQPLWDTRHASATLLALIALTVLFFNGAYQDGQGDPPYSPWVRHLVEAAVGVIPVFAAITLYALYLRIDQYGLTNGRFYALLFAVGSMLCGLGYAAAVFNRREGWMAFIRPVNVGMACVVAVCAVLVHTPVLDPFRWSARSQFSRIAEGDVDASEFDFGYLRFELGHVGHETLERLEELTDHPQADIISQRISATRAAESYYEVRPQPETLLSASDIVPFDTATALPDSLVRYVVSTLTQYQADGCDDNGDCTMFGVDLDSDADLEFVLVLSGGRNYEMVTFDRNENGEWVHIGRMRPLGPRARLPERATLLNTIRQTGLLTEQPRYRDLVVGELKLRVMR